jgi:hypothetical protein
MENIWDNPDEDMINRVKEINKRTGIDEDIVLSVFKASQELFNEYVEKTLSIDNKGQ